MNDKTGESAETLKILRQMTESDFHDPLSGQSPPEDFNTFSNQKDEKWEIIKIKIVNSRVGGKHKILIKDILDKSDMNQSEFLRFAIEEGYKTWIMQKADRFQRNTALAPKNKPH